MSTKILWCDETINPIIGCSKISDGCRNCYAEKMARRLATMASSPQYKQVIYPSGPKKGCWNGVTNLVTSELSKPYKWKRPRSIFVSSMGDLFHDTVQHEWLDSVMRMVADNERHTFIFLTKRPGNMKRYFDGYHIPNSRPHPNLVLGTSVEDQQTADERIPILRGIPAAKIFVSIEPMVGPIDLRLDCEKCGHLTDAECPGSGRNCRMIRPLDCVILGGESGGNARRLDPQWVVSIRDQCGYAGVPFMFKQWSHENKNEVDAASGFPLLQGGLTHSALAWNIKNNIKEI